MAGDRFRALDSWHFRFLNSDSDTIQAADEIIDTPDKHLLTQDQIFSAEGGAVGLAVQAAGVGVGLAVASVLNPRITTYFRNGQLRATEWILLLGASYFGY